jgi:predicted small lipoprotein YifL
MISHLVRAALTLLALSLAACGQKGPLYIPDTTQGEIVTRPASTDVATGTSTGSSNSPAAPDSPDRAASPAPEVSAPQPAAGEDPKKKDKSSGTQPPPK